MTREEILTAAKIFDDQNIPFVVMLSDGTEYYHGYEGNIVVWPAAGCGVALSIRFNVKPNQSAKPFEVSAFGFDQVNAIYADISDKKHIEEALKAIGRTDVVPDIMKYINDHDELFKPTITGSTGDLVGTPYVDIKGNKVDKHWNGNVNRYDNANLNTNL